MIDKRIIQRLGSIAQNVLVRRVMEVNTDESYFSNLLKNKTNGIVVRETSNVFLTALKSETEKLVA